MAEKNHDKSGGKEGIHIAEIIFGILILLYFLSLLGGFISRHWNSGGTGGVGSSISRAFVNIFPTLEFIAIFFTLLFIMGIIYASFRLHHLHKATKLHRQHQMVEKMQIYTEKRENPKWQKVLEHVNSANPSDWRLAILEADILLSDILEKMGYHGEGIGEMLKKVEESDFHTINSAWEAHKIRNAIAHEGVDFTLTQKEAKRVIGLYQSVFEEFHFV